MANSPLSGPDKLAFAGDKVLVTNLGIFNGAPNPVVRHTMARLQAGLMGVGGNGNH